MALYQDSYSKLRKFSQMAASTISVFVWDEIAYEVNQFDIPVKPDWDQQDPQTVMQDIDSAVDQICEIDETDNEYFEPKQFHESGSTWCLVGTFGVHKATGTYVDFTDPEKARAVAEQEMEQHIHRDDPVADLPSDDLDNGMGGDAPLE